MKHRLVWGDYADPACPYYAEQSCSCGEDFYCPALQFNFAWLQVIDSLREMCKQFIPMLRTRWAARGDGEQA